MILTKEQIKKIKDRFMSLCSEMDYLNNHYDLLEIYYGFNKEEGRKAVHPKELVDDTQRQIDIIVKFSHNYGFDLWSENE